MLMILKCMPKIMCFYKACNSPSSIYFHHLHQTDNENVTVQMSHPGIIIQTVTSEDLSDPLGQSELEAEEQELVKEEPSENQNNTGEDEQSEERSKDMQESEKVSSEALTKVSDLNPLICS